MTARLASNVHQHDNTEMTRDCGMQSPSTLCLLFILYIIPGEIRLKDQIHTGCLYISLNTLIIKFYLLRGLDIVHLLSLWKILSRSNTNIYVTRLQCHSITHVLSMEWNQHIFPPSLSVFAHGPRTVWAIIMYLSVCSYIGIHAGEQLTRLFYPYRTSLNGPVVEYMLKVIKLKRITG